MNCGLLQHTCVSFLHMWSTGLHPPHASIKSSLRGKYRTSNQRVQYSRPCHTIMFYSSPHCHFHLLFQYKTDWNETKLLEISSEIQARYPLTKHCSNCENTPNHKFKTERLYSTHTNPGKRDQWHPKTRAPPSRAKYTRHIVLTLLLSGHRFSILSNSEPDLDPGDPKYNHKLAMIISHLRHEVW